MTQKITTDREILEQYRDERIKDLFVWALGGSPINEMTKTVRDNNPNRILQVKFYKLSWTQVLQVQKNCEFKNVTPAELIASKFLSITRRSAGVYELKKKLRKSDITIQTITDLIHEYMNDSLDESINSNDGREK